MPELPEVETVMRGLERAMKGRVITQAKAARTTLRGPLPHDFADRMAGRTVKAFTRRAKYILVSLDHGETLLVHLGMSGRFRIGKALDSRPHDHVVFTLDDGNTVVFNDPRRFGQIDLFDATPRSLAALGPEPLDDTAFNGKVLQAALEGRKTPVKLALLDQKIVAGIGNIYACEALYMARIHPSRPAGSLNAKECALLAQAVKDVLVAAIKAGGSTLRDYRTVEDGLGYFQHDFKVYDREGKPCPLSPNHVIERFTQGGRSTYWCPGCQKMPLKK